jgi:hypothetical protein
MVSTNELRADRKPRLRLPSCDLLAERPRRIEEYGSQLHLTISGSDFDGRKKTHEAIK